MKPIEKIVGFCSCMIFEIVISQLSHYKANIWNLFSCQHWDEKSLIQLLLLNISMACNYWNHSFSSTNWRKKNPLVSRPLHFFVPNFFCIILLDVVLIYSNISWWSYKLSEFQIKVKENFVFQNDSFYFYERALKLCRNETF